MPLTYAQISSPEEWNNLLAEPERQCYAVFVLAKADDGALASATVEGKVPDGAYHPPFRIGARQAPIAIPSFWRER
jgi:hypothetical protein